MKQNKKLGAFNKEDSFFFLSNQRPDRDRGDHFDKTQILCFFRQVTLKHKSFIISYREQTDGSRKFRPKF